MKTKIKAALLVSAIIPSLLTVLAVLPISDSNNAKFVFAASAAQWPNTNISTVRLRSATYQVAIYYGTNETVYTTVGENISEVRVAVNIATTYANSASEAMSCTKVHVTISHPTQGTIFSDYLDAVEASPWGDFYNVLHTKTFSNHTIVEGIYTVTTVYQVYA